MTYELSEYIGFLDESGDHSLANTDPDFPMFVLSLVLVRREIYQDIVLVEMNELKLRYWNHEGINFHSRDIRKKQGAFSELVRNLQYSQFVLDLTKLMERLEYELFVVAINKAKLKQRYSQAQNPYELSLKFLMERLLRCISERNISKLPIIAEARGKVEDNALKAVFFDIFSRGTEYHKREEFQGCQFTLEFQKKSNNIAGIQIADLCAYPCARYSIDPEKANPAFDVVRKHIYDSNETRGIGYGWKRFP